MPPLEARVSSALPIASASAGSSSSSMLRASTSEGVLFDEEPQLASIRTRSAIDTSLFTGGAHSEVAVQDLRVALEREGHNVTLSITEDSDRDVWSVRCFVPHEH